MAPVDIMNKAVVESEDLLKLICTTIKITPEDEVKETIDEYQDDDERKPTKRLKTVTVDEIEEQLGFHDCERTAELGNGLFSPDSENVPDSLEEINKPSDNVCVSCGFPVTETFVFKLSGFSYHEHCLSCSVCSILLGESEKCFSRDGNLYCREDFLNFFGTKCAKCDRKLSSSDWVRQVHGLYFHLDCFSCSTCKFQLATGDNFGLKNGSLLCKTHFLETPNEFDSSPEPMNKNRGQKRKRMRTTFADDQLAVLQEYFKVEPNPQGHALTQIAEKVKLSRRVTQIWFQNTRAKIRQQKLQQLA